MRNKNYNNAGKTAVTICGTRSQIQCSCNKLLKCSHKYMY